jgi:hypothetical protein
MKFVGIIWVTRKSTKIDQHKRSHKEIWLNCQIWVLPEIWKMAFK